MFWVRYPALEHGDETGKPFLLGYESADDAEPLYRIRHHSVKGWWSLESYGGTPKHGLVIAAGLPTYVRAAVRLHYNALKGKRQ